MLALCWWGLPRCLWIGGGSSKQTVNHSDAEWPLACADICVLGAGVGPAARVWAGPEGTCQREPPPGRARRRGPRDLGGGPGGCVVLS